MRALSLLLAMVATPALSHEFWIEPTAYKVAAQTKIEAQLVNGEDFKGSLQPYLTQRFVRFQMVADGNVEVVPGRNGDNPAVNVDPIGDGLHVFSYQSTRATLNYANWEKFQKFVDHKDFGDVRALHDARGLPDADFVEVYSRFSKTLVAVGDGAGSDFRTGMETEIVALDNPYTDDLSDGMSFEVHYRNDMRPNARFEVFEKAPDDTVTVTFYETDADGRVTIPVQSGYRYMADAVVLREPSDALAETSGGVWETLWANITWAVP